MTKASPDKIPSCVVSHMKLVKAPIHHGKGRNQRKEAETELHLCDCSVRIWVERYLNL
jgi:hypothetical protein